MTLQRKNKYALMQASFPSALVESRKKQEHILLDRITIDPHIMIGKPIIKGTRITVQHILGLLAQGAAYHDILHDYPHITQEDIFACLLFAQQAIESSVFTTAVSGHGGNIFEKAEFCKKIIYL
jgi:uncharacterized protein (DUF433 family)